MDTLRATGIHWPNGPSKDARLYALPSPVILMLSTEARFRSADAFIRGKQLVYRAIPRIGKRPAELKYNASKIADECVLLWNEQPHDPAERLIFQALNEPTINTERGDDENDFDDLDARFARLAKLESELEPELRRRLPPGTRLMSTPHVPDGRAYDRLSMWWDAANRFDVIGHHEYGPPEGIAERVQWHLDTWPDRCTFLGEWHNDEPERTLQLLAEIAAREPRFLGAAWFIGKWFDAPDWWPSWKNLQDNDDLYSLFKNPPIIAAPAPEPEPEPVIMTAIEAFVRDAAQKRGIDPDIAVRVANSEGSVTEPARRGTFDTGSSWWPFQLHYGGAGYEYLGTVAGMGNGFTALTGWQPGDPAACNDSIRYALNRANLGGWGPWYGAAHVGIGRWDGIDRNAAWDASSEPWDYETPAVAPAPDVLAYNPDAQVDRQPDDWSCSVQSVQWLLRALGRNPSDAWMEQSLVPAVVSKSVGLLNATGQGMAEWIEREYGYPAVWRSGVSFDDVLALAGKQPVMVGGRAYGPGGHWVGVRRADENGWLELANSAPNYTNTGTHLDRNEWAARGPWSLITVPVAVQEAEEVTVAEAEQLRAENQRLRDVIGYASHDVAAAAQKEADTLRSSLDALQAAIDTLKRQAA